MVGAWAILLGRAETMLFLGEDLHLASVRALRRNRTRNISRRLHTTPCEP